MKTQLTLPTDSTTQVMVRSEPRLWVKELAVYREFNPQAEIRRVTLRPGLNIIWAQDSETGASGHAAGKSTFCRMLRYMIGDQSYGSEVFRKAFRGKFPNACLLGEVHLDGTPWIIVRPLGRVGKHWCMPGAEWSGIFSPETKHHDYQEFIAALTAKFIEPLASSNFPGSDNEVEWLYLLQWLTRDQDARYSHLLEWRPFSGEGHEAKHLSASEKTNLIRMVLGLLKPEEHESQEAHAELLAKQNELDGAIPKLAFSRDRTLAELVAKGRIPAPDKTDVSMLLAGLRKELDETITREEKAFAEANHHDGVGDILAAELEHARKRKSELNSSHDQQTNQTKLDRLRLRHQKGELSKEELAAQSAELGDIKGKCSNSLEMAHAFSCPIAPHMQRDDLQEARVCTARSSVEQWEEQLRLDEKARAVTKKQLEEAIKIEEKLSDKITAMRTAHSTHRAQLHNQLTQNRALRDTIDRALSDNDEIISKRDLLKGVRKEIAASQKHLAALRKIASQRLSELGQQFSQVASELLQQEVDGSVKFNSEEIVPDLDYEGDMSSAALVTLRLLIFDLACLVGSVGPFDLHPGFLLHDSPREADLSASLYRRIFTLIAGDEEENTCVQYIIATTEPPPTRLQTTPWLVCEPLSSAEPTSRFLKSIV